MKPSVLLLAFLLAAPAPAQHHSDERLAERFTTFLNELYELDFTPAQKAELRQFVLAYRPNRDRDGLRSAEESVKALSLVESSDPSLRAVVMRMSRPTILRGTHAAAETGRADSKWLLDLYYRKNPALAPAKPGGLPLTRDMVEADLLVKHWLATEIHQQRAPLPDARVIEAAVQAAIRNHPQLTPEQQFQLASQPGELARIRWAWPRASAIDRLITRSEMGARLTPQEQMMIQQVMAQFNSQLNGMMAQQNSMLSGMIQNMKQNSETIMGRGTVWNPAANRWEQQGGIVTEYNGTVRVP